jgi:hypothetical protein
MLAVLKTLWNLPGTAVDLLADQFHATRRRIHKGCGGHWRKQKRDGKSFERCLKCGKERRARSP